MAKKKKPAAEPQEPMVEEKKYRVVSIRGQLVSYVHPTPESMEAALIRLTAARIFPGQILKLEEATTAEVSAIRRLSETDTFIDPTDTQQPTPPPVPTEPDPGSED